MLCCFSLGIPPRAGHSQKKATIPSANTDPAYEHVDSTQYKGGVHVSLVAFLEITHENTPDGSYEEPAGSLM